MGTLVSTLVPQAAHRLYQNLLLLLPSLLFKSLAHNGKTPNNTARVDGFLFVILTLYREFIPILIANFSTTSVSWAQGHLFYWALPLPPPQQLSVFSPCYLARGNINTNGF